MSYLEDMEGLEAALGCSMPCLLTITTKVWHEVSTKLALEIPSMGGNQVT